MYIDRYPFMSFITIIHQTSYVKLCHSLISVYCFDNILTILFVSINDAWYCYKRKYNKQSTKQCCMLQKQANMWMQQSMK